MAETPILAIENLRKSFDGLVAVDNMNFELSTNEILGLIGPKGSGKTTMINLISGALSPTSGVIRLDGEPISGDPAHVVARKGISRTFQFARVLESLPVVQNVAAGGVFGHRRRWGQDLTETATDLLARVGLDGAADRPMNSLVYIDQKRVELARALMADPRVLMLDEWLAGLNPIELQIGISLIEELRAEGRAIIIVEPVMDAIRSLCDRCVVMNSGRLIAEGATAHVLADPRVTEVYLGDADV